VLIVFDNCEHTVTDAAVLAEALLQRAPRLPILATGRDLLRAQGEGIPRLRPLDTPQATATSIIADALRFPSLRLFVERAVAVMDTFELTDTDVPDLAGLRGRLDGIPLAIELAAARVDVFGIAGLVAHLGDQLSILTRAKPEMMER
jgi:predicted ATPase